MFPLRLKDIKEELLSPPPKKKERIKTTNNKTLRIVMELVHYKI